MWHLRPSGGATDSNAVSLLNVFQEGRHILHVNLSIHAAR
jgi:hypothetical protein